MHPYHLAVLGLLVFSSACSSQPAIPRGIWDAECEVGPPLQLEFPGNDDPDRSGNLQVRRATVRIPLDGAGLADLYRMQLTIHDSEVLTVTTDWMQHVPMPASMEAEWELEALDIDITSLQEHDVDCDDAFGSTDGRADWAYHGTCTWGAESGAFRARAHSATDCASADGPPWLAGVALLLVLFRRRTGWVLLGLAGCGNPEGRWQGRMGSEIRVEIGIPEKKAEIPTFGKLWTSFWPEEVAPFTCTDEKRWSGHFTAACEVTAPDGGSTGFSIDLDVGVSRQLQSLDGAFTWQDDSDVGTDSTVELVVMGPAPEQVGDEPALQIHPRQGICEGDTGTSTSYWGGTEPPAKRLVYLTQASTSGDIGGVAGADARCALEAPDPTHTYKALLVDGVNRYACRTPNCSSGASEGKDWPLQPAMEYLGPTGSVLGTTNDSGILSFPFPSNLDRNGGLAWTGLAADWTPADTCNGWTAGDHGSRGTVGNASAQASGFLDDGEDHFCDEPDVVIYCVEQ